MRLRLFVVAIFVCAFFSAAPSNAQFFRNNAFTIQAGWMGLGSTWDNATNLKLWNMTDEVVLGGGYSFAVGYNNWIDISATLGGGSVIITSEPTAPILFTLEINTGYRYNFLEERFRPFVCVKGQYFQVVTGSAEIPNNAFFGNSPFWVGARVGGGAEFFHLDDQSIQLEATLNGYFGANNPPPGGDASFVLPSSSATVTYFIYF